MEFGQGFWGPVVATGAMLLGALIAWLALVANWKLVPSRPSTEKNRTYGCGEIVKSEETNPDAAQFYSPIRRVFGKLYKKILPGHSGDLNYYLTWIVFGTVVIFIWIGIEMG